MKTCIILIGNIASGKSTAALEFLKYDFKVVSADGIRRALHGGEYIFDKQVESIIWSCEFRLFTLLLEHGYSVVVDATNLTKYRRNRYLDYLKNDYPQYYIMAVVMPKIQLRITLRRKKALGGLKDELKVWRDVYTKFKESMELPEDGEFQEVVYL
jgi:predicted kinase